MSILFVIVVVLVVAALLIYGVDQAPQLAAFAGLIKLVILVGAALYVIHRAGLA